VADEAASRELAVRTGIAVLAGGAGLLGPDTGAAVTALTPVLEAVLSRVLHSLSRHRSAHVAETPEDAAEAAGDPVELLVERRALGNISDVKVTGPLTLTMTMDKAYNPTWFTDNELSQLTPMPMAWDKTASGPSDCTAVTADCAKVYAYLDSQSKSLSTWVSSPVWSVVDGPWKLASFNADGNSTLIDFELTDEGAYRGCSSRRPGGMSARSTESCECLSGRRGP
jgi:hypothetical protein